VHTTNSYSFNYQTRDNLDFSSVPSVSGDLQEHSSSFIKIVTRAEKNLFAAGGKP